MTVAVAVFLVIVASWAALNSSSKVGATNGQLWLFVRRGALVSFLYSGCMTGCVAALLSNASSEWALKTGATLSCVCIMVLGLGFLFYGLKLHKALTSSNFTSKHAKSIFFYTLAFAICLQLQALVDMVSTYFPSVFADSNGFYALNISRLVLKCFGSVLILGMFKRAVSNLAKKEHLNKASKSRVYSIGHNQKAQGNQKALSNNSWAVSPGKKARKTKSYSIHMSQPI